MGSTSQTLTVPPSGSAKTLRTWTATRLVPQPKTLDYEGASDCSRFAAAALSKDGLLTVTATRPGQLPPIRRVVCSKMDPTTSFQSHPFVIVTNQRSATEPPLRPCSPSSHGAMQEETGQGGYAHAVHPARGISTLNETVAPPASCSGVPIARQLGTLS